MGVRKYRRRYSMYRVRCYVFYFLIVCMRVNSGFSCPPRTVAIVL
jgi:hypothetical protein